MKKSSIPKPVAQNAGIEFVRIVGSGQEPRLWPVVGHVASDGVEEMLHFFRDP